MNYIKKISKYLIMKNSIKNLLAIILVLFTVSTGYSQRVTRFRTDVFLKKVDAGEVTDSIVSINSNGKLNYIKKSDIIPEIPEPVPIELNLVESGNGLRAVYPNNSNSYGPTGNKSLDLSLGSRFNSVSGATGFNSLAFGEGSIASGFQAICFKGGTASGENSVNFATSGLAAGLQSFAIQNANRSNGDYSIAAGIANTAPSYGEIILGPWAEELLTGNATTWTATDRLFSLGNGSGSSTRQNAVTIFKSGVFLAPSTDLVDITDPKSIITKEYFDANTNSSPTITAGVGISNNSNTFNLGNTLPDGQSILWQLGNSVNTGGLGGTLDSNITIQGNFGEQVFRASDTDAYLGAGSAILSSFETSGVNNLLRLSNAGGIYTDNTNTGGLKYESDYSANYTDRSLVDKAYVDSQTLGGVVEVNEGGNLGYALSSDDRSFKSPIGPNAVDLSTNDFGTNAGATGSEAIVTGFGSLGAGDSSFTGGQNIQNTGTVAFAYGAGMTPTGAFSSSFGFGGQGAQSFGEFKAGTNPTDYTPTSVNIWNASDRLFVFGNGQNTANKSDLFLGLKNGEITAPSTEISDIDAAGAKSIITKEYLEANLSSGSIAVRNDMDFTFDVSGRSIYCVHEGNKIFVNIDGLQTGFGSVGVSIHNFENDPNYTGPLLNLRGNLCDFMLISDDATQLVRCRLESQNIVLKTAMPSGVPFSGNFTIVLE